MKIRYTVVAVILFIVLLVLAMKSAEANEPSYEGVRISLGHTVANSSATWGEIGYEFKNNWELAASINGADETRNGWQDKVYVASLSKVIRPEWRIFDARNYYRLGVSYLNESNLVGKTNYRLGVGLEWKHIQVEYFHYSSAGIHKPNTGIDGILLRLKY